MPLHSDTTSWVGKNWIAPRSGRAGAKPRCAWLKSSSGAPRTASCLHGLCAASFGQQGHTMKQSRSASSRALLINGDREKHLNLYWKPTKVWELRFLYLKGRMTVRKIFPFLSVGSLPQMLQQSAGSQELHPHPGLPHEWQWPRYIHCVPRYIIRSSVRDEAARTRTSTPLWGAGMQAVV